MSNILENAKDLGQGIYTQAEVDSKDLTAKSDAIQANHGFKNYIINGGFDVWQRGISFSLPTDFTADRWTVRVYSSVGASTYVVSKNYSNVYGNYFKLEVAGASSNAYIQQRIEEPARFSSKTLTLSFDSIGNASNPSQTFKARIYLYTTTNGYIPINTDTIYTMTTTTTRESITFTCPDFSSYTIDSNSYLLVGIESTTAIQDGSYRFGRFQLEEGSVATPFEHRPYGLELSLCQRYYETSASGIKYIPLVYGYTYRSNIYFSEQKRVAPTISVSGYSGGGAQIVSEFTTVSGFQTGSSSPTSTPYFTAWTAEAEL